MWELIRILLPSVSIYSRRSSRMLSLAITSRPAVGSSRTRSLASKLVAVSTFNFAFIPVENSFSFLSMGWKTGCTASQTSPDQISHKSLSEYAQSVSRSNNWKNRCQKVSRLYFFLFLGNLLHILIKQTNFSCIRMNQPQNNLKGSRLPCSIGSRSDR